MPRRARNSVEALKLQEADLNAAARARKFGMPKQAARYERQAQKHWETFLDITEYEVLGTTRASRRAAKEAAKKEAAKKAAKGDR